METTEDVEADLRRDLRSIEAIDECWLFELAKIEGYRQALHLEAWSLVLLREVKFLALASFRSPDDLRALAFSLLI